VSSDPSVRAFLGLLLTSLSHQANAVCRNHSMANIQALGRWA
jgi:hypothetical protein